MALEAWELAQRHQGNIAGAEMARVLREQYGDIPLFYEADEKAIKIKKFTDKQKEALIERNFTAVYLLSGQSIKSLREAGRKFSKRCRSYPDVENLTSRLSEVAINPNQLFLPGSDRKIFEEQIRILQDFSFALSKGRNRIQGVDAILGTASDYAELVFLHLDKTGEYLFGSEYGNVTRTATITRAITDDSFGIISVGCDDNELILSHWSPLHRLRGLRVSPLVVPA